MAELRTFLFTAICGSVRLKNEMPGRSVSERDLAFINSILRPHRQRIEERLAEFGGRVVSTAGDGHFLVFDHTAQAALWAVAVQESHRDDPILLGAQILKVSLAFDQRVGRGETPQAAATVLLARPGEYNPRIVHALVDVRFDTMAHHPAVVSIARLEPGMIIDEDVRTHAGLLLVARGQETTHPLLIHLRNFHHHRAIADEVRVLVLRPAFDVDADTARKAS